MRFELETAVWELTLRCCFSCKYCGSGGGRARADELSEEEALSVADQLAELGVRRVSLIGGEVFLRPDWERITARLVQSGIRVNLITNGFLFTPELLGRIRALGVESVSVSLDGLREVHDAYRQAGSYDRALRAIEALTENGIPTSVISTLNRENAAGLPELLEVLLRYPIGAWQLQACSPMGNAAREGVDFAFDVPAVLRFVEENAPRVPFLLGVADNIGYFTPAEGTLRGDLGGRGCFAGCRAGLTNIGIDSIGNVRGCESMYDDRFIEGNLREKTLREIWEDPEAFSYNRRFTRADLTGPCADCPEGGRCAGGCRSYNYFVHGKLYEAPFCARVSRGGNMLRSAYFAGGCFWCITPSFAALPGVSEVESGYSGGTLPFPRYEQVKSQTTGHRETVRVSYDPACQSFGDLCRLFLQSVDPFDGGGQYMDRGHSYTLAVYYQGEDERAAAEALLRELSAETGLTPRVALEPFTAFYPAEEEHQDFYRKEPERFARELEERAAYAAAHGSEIER